ncbi:hypothetical protein CRE_12416 [Caenorhabditis remanei]|uniref:Uncharacterized protein n=1 Tax=Caenorhabditis remanei TaxID=31234 RepID=E3NQ43_CAERE|nr:hypothetical protein CRE_12416 [Caenorhabditis remanei]
MRTSRNFQGESKKRLDAEHIDIKRVQTPQLRRSKRGNDLKKRTSRGNVATTEHKLPDDGLEISVSLIQNS